MTDRITYLDRKIRQLEAERQRAEEEIARLVQLGDDVYPDDSVLLFRKYFNADEYHDGRPVGPYTYVALKVAGSWWLTGNSGSRRHSWESLVKFLSHNVDELWEASEWVRVQ